MSGTHRRGARSRLVPLAAVASIPCIPAAVGVALLVRHDSADAAVQSARQQALTAASRIAREVLSYDYRTIDRDIATARADTTGLFAKQYATTAAQLKSEAQQARAIVQATPSAPGIVAASRDTVVVLVFVDQASVKQLPGQKTPTTRIDQSRVQMTLDRTDGGGRVAHLGAFKGSAGGRPEHPGGGDAAGDLVGPAIDRVRPAEQEQPLERVEVPLTLGGRRSRAA